MSLHIHPAVLRVLDHKKLVVCLSGGADSVAALLVMAATVPVKRIVAGHFNHHLRGEESDGDALFCKELCKKLNVAYEEANWESPTKSEASARDARMGFIQSLLSKYQTPYFVTGHHLNDVAETMLMRLVRGSGCDGLSSPKPVQPNGIGIALRPLLGHSKAEIEAWLTDQKSVWRVDSTNAQCEFTRNIVRNEILPKLLAVDQRNGLQAIASGRELLEEENDALEFFASQYKVGQILELSALKRAPQNVLRRVLLKWVSLHNLELSRQGMDDLIRFVQTKVTASFSVKGGFIVMKKSSTLERTHA